MLDLELTHLPLVLEGNAYFHIQEVVENAWKSWVGQFDIETMNKPRSQTRRMRNAIPEICTRSVVEDMEGTEEFDRNKLIGELREAIPHEGLDESGILSEEAVREGFIEEIANGTETVLGTLRDEVKDVNPKVVQDVMDVVRNYLQQHPKYHTINASFIANHAYDIAVAVERTHSLDDGEAVKEAIRAAARLGWGKLSQSDEKALREMVEAIGELA